MAAAVGQWRQGHLGVVEVGADEPLERHRILAMPASGFGSTHASLSVLSSLAFVSRDTVGDTGA